MAYLIIEDFKGGLDTRKSAFTAPPGTLRELTNAHLTRGGEIEKRKAMVVDATLPTGVTFGLHAVRGVLYVFGTEDEANVTVPAGYAYQKLTLTTPGPTITRVVSATSFRGKPYVVAEFSNNERHHFYNGAQVSDWDARYGTLGSNDDVAAALAALIGSRSDVTASALANVVTVEAVVANTAFAYSSQALNGAGGVNDQAITETVVASPAPGVKQKISFTVGGTYEDADQFSITVAGTAYTVSGQDASVPTSVRTFKEKVYCTAGSVLGFSGQRGDPLTPDPTAWSPTFAGAGAINLSRVDEYADALVACAVYQDSLAVFSRRSVQIWSVDPDPDKNYLVQVLNYCGARAPNAIVSLGEIDLFFLADTGIRSLRARDISNLASTQDVGTAIDPEVVSWMRSLDPAVVDAAAAAVDPAEGRVFVTIGGRTFVFTHFPGSNVSAWSTYEFGFSPETYATVGTSLYARAGDTVYLYGGADGAQYDSAAVTAKLPFHDCGTPATLKTLTGIDVGCIGDWEISVALDPENAAAEDVIARVSGSTYGLRGRYTAAGHGTHFSLIFRHEAEGAALLANAVLHYDAGEAG